MLGFEGGRKKERREGGGLVYLEVLAGHRGSSATTSEELGALEWLGAYFGDTVHLFTTVAVRTGEYGLPHTFTHVVTDLVCERLLHLSFSDNPADEGSQVLADLDSPTQIGRASYRERV